LQEEEGLDIVKMAKRKHKGHYNRRKFCRLLVMGLASIGSGGFPYTNPKDPLMIDRALESALLTAINKEGMKIDFNMVLQDQFKEIVMNADYVREGKAGPQDVQIKYSKNSANAILKSQTLRGRDVQGFRNVARVFWESLDPKFGQDYEEYRREYGKESSPLG
jgi:hypothetical protein